MFKVKDLKTLRKLPTRKEGDLALVEETHTIYKFDGAHWEIQSHTGINVSLYELNQAAMTTMPEYNHSQISAAKRLINDYCRHNQGSFYVLLNNEQKYYTLFMRTDDYNYPIIENEVIDCLRALGAIKDISKTEQGAIECWVTSGDTSYVYYFFNYDEGVIKCV